MKTHYINLKANQFLLLFITSFLLVSCGTYQSVYNDDGIYGDDTSTKENKKVVYLDREEYKEYNQNYFTKELDRIESIDNNDVFTDVDNYRSSENLDINEEQFENSVNNEPWGYNENNDVVVQVHLNTSPYWNDFYDYNYGYASYRPYRSTWSYGFGYGYRGNHYNPYWHPNHSPYYWSNGFYASFYYPSFYYGYNRPYYRNTPYRYNNNNYNRSYRQGRRTAYNNTYRNNSATANRNTTSRRSTSTTRRSTNYSNRNARTTNSNTSARRSTTSTRSNANTRNTTTRRNTSSRNTSNRSSTTRRSGSTRSTGNNTVRKSTNNTRSYTPSRSTNTSSRSSRTSTTNRGTTSSRGTSTKSTSRRNN